MNNPTKMRFLFVSHRTLSCLEENQPRLDTIGGVVSTVETAMQKLGGLWIGWGSSGQPILGRKVVTPKNSYCGDIKFINLSRQEIVEYYQGFANNILWPLCHSFPDKWTLCYDQWQAYKQVNWKFASSIQEELALRDLEESNLKDIIWIHDYHLALTPQFVRCEFPDVPIVYFWHIPFPNLETFRLLPSLWSKDLLIGLLHASLLVFHIESYTENFLHCVEELLAASVDWERGVISFDGKTTVVRTIPLGIDFESWQKLANSPDIKSKTQMIRAEVGVEFLGLAVDRLDYTKGILERVRAVELFLQENPNYRGRFTLLQIAAPSRTGIDQYRKYREQVEREISRLNNRLGTEGWQPIKYLYKSVPRQKLPAYYQAADLACILPLRDGMNLVAKEYVACCLDNNGAVLLSNTAGVAEEFGNDALLVNPLDRKAVAKAIKKGIELDSVTRATKMAQLREKVGHHDLNWWLQLHLNEIGAFLPKDMPEIFVGMASRSSLEH